MALDTYVGIAKHAGLRHAQALLDALATLEGDPLAVADTLRAHHLIGLVRSSVAPAALAARVPRRLVESLESRPSVQRVPPHALLEAFDEVRRALAAAGVPVLMLKGLYFAERLYGGLGHRPQHDVDILVRHRRRALRVIRRLGYERRSRDLHSWSFGRGDLRLDLHGVVRWAPAFRLDEDAFWRDAIEVRLGGIAVPTLSDEHTLVALVLAAFEDLGQGMAKLKQLLDLYLLLRQVDGTLDWTSFLARRRDENLLQVTVNVLALVADLFEAREELPCLAAALDAHRTPRPRGTRGRAGAGRRAAEGGREHGVVRSCLPRLPRPLARLVLVGRLPGQPRAARPGVGARALAVGDAAGTGAPYRCCTLGRRVAPLHWRGRYLAGLILGGAVLAQFLLIVYLGDRAYWDVLRAVSFGAGSRKASSRSAPTWTKPRRSSALCSGIAWESSSASPASRPSTSEHSSRSSPCSTRSDAVCTNGE